MWMLIICCLAHNDIFYVMPLSGLSCYIIFWFAVLYLFLDCNVIIPMSGCFFIPTSVMVTSVFSEINLKHFIPTSGFQCYTYICYVSCIFQIRYEACYTYIQYGVKIYTLVCHI